MTYYCENGDRKPARFLYIFFIISCGFLTVFPIAGESLRIPSPTKEFSCIIIITNQRIEVSIEQKATGSVQKVLTEAYRYTSLVDKSIDWKANDLLEITIPTGSPGIYAVYFSTKLNRLSKKFDFPIAADSKNHWVLTGTEKVLVQEMFGIGQYEIVGDFSASAITYLDFDRSQTKFDAFGNLALVYKNRGSRTRNVFIPFHTIVAGMGRI